VSLRSGNALGHFTRATLCESLQIKCRGPEPRPKLCASLRRRNAFGSFTKAILCENSKEFIWSPEPRRRLCASLRNRNALGHFTRATLCENLQIKCRRPAEHPDQAPAFTLTVITPQCGHAVWGKTYVHMYIYTNKYICIDLYMNKNSCTYMYMKKYTCIYIHRCICIYIYKYIYIYCETRRAPSLPVRFHQKDPLREEIGIHTK